MKLGILTHLNYLQPSPIVNFAKINKGVVVSNIDTIGHIISPSFDSYGYRQTIVRRSFKSHVTKYSSNIVRSIRRRAINYYEIGKAIEQNGYEQDKILHILLGGYDCQQDEEMVLEHKLLRLSLILVYL